MTSPRAAQVLHRRRSAFPLSFERLEDRCYLSASADLNLAVAALPAITEQQALALALNDLAETADGFIVTNRRHTASLTPAGLSMEPVDGGPLWHWQLSYVGSPTAALTSVKLGQVEPESDGQMLVRYDRGAVVEQYVARLDSIEQQFVIAQPLALGGQDLVVVGTIQSDGAFETSGDGWLWRTDTGVISLGDVTVLDATGSELEASMSVSATETRIVVDADALRDAVYPLLIDPEVGTNDFRISDMGPGASEFDAQHAAIAYNSTDNQYLVVWSGDDFNTTELEIFGQLINAATGAPVGQDDFRISDLGIDGIIHTDAFGPAVAYNSTNNEYLAVWRGDNLDDDLEVWGQRLLASGAEIGLNDFEISSTGPPGNTTFATGSPDVAYNSADNEYLVVWEADHLVNSEYEIFGQRLDAATGNAVGADDFRISDMGPNGDTTFSATAPAVAYNSVDNEYVVVWVGDDDTAPLVNNEYEIFRQRLSATGVELGANDFRISDMGPNGNTLLLALVADVAYNSTNNEYLVVWRGDDVTDDEVEIFGQRLNSTTAPIGANDFRISQMGPDGDTLFTVGPPSVTYSAAVNEYLVVWSGQDDTAPLVRGEDEIFGQRLSGATAAAVGSDDFRISDIGPNGNTSLDALNAVVSFNSVNNEYLVVWEADFRNEEFEIFTQRLTAATGAEVGTNDRRISDVGSEGNFTAREAAIAFNSTSNEYLVVWAGEDTVNDEFEIFGQRIDATTGAGVGVNDFRISDMGPDGNTLFTASKPAVAFNSTNNQYLVVWRGEDDIAPLVVNEIEVFGRRISSIGVALSSDFRISDMGTNGSGSFGIDDPAVAYNSTNNEYFVVWSGDDNTAPLVNNEFEIFGQRLSGITAAAVGANDFRISDMGPNGNVGYDASNPAVAYNSTSNEYLVVWEGDDSIAPLVNNETEIFGQRITAATGAAVGVNDFRISDMGPDGNTDFFATEPEVAYNNTLNQYLVVWSGTDVVPGEREIFGQRVSGVSSASVGANDFRISDMGPDGNGDFDAFEPAVAYNSITQSYFVVWHGDDNTAPLVDQELEIFGQELSGLGAALGINDVRLSDIGPDGDVAFYANDAMVAASSTNQFLVVWDGRETGNAFGNGDTEIFGQFFEIGNPVAAPNSSSTLQASRGNDVFARTLPLLGVNPSSGNLLIGDSTAVDRRDNALSDILREWSAQPVARAVAGLLTVPPQHVARSGDRPQRNVTSLPTSIGGMPLSSTKILSDRQVDLLIGGASRDWFEQLSLDALLGVLQK